MRTSFGAYQRLLDSVSRHAAQRPHDTGLPPVGTSDTFNGTTGDDNFTGTNNDDIFNFIDGGNDTAEGRNGHDHFNFFDTLTADDKIKGGGDYDFLTLDGDYSTQLVFKSGTMGGIEEIDCASSGDQYVLKLKDANVDPVGGNDANIFLASFAVVCGISSRLDFDASNETTAAFNVFGGEGDDVIRTGDGIDVIHGDTGTNLIYGGAGEDRAAHDTVPTAVTVDLGIIGSQHVADFTDNTYQGIEDVSGGALGDTLTGDRDANWLWGVAGTDTLTGNKGDDRLEGGLGADTMEGGRGDDHYLYGISGSPGTTDAEDDSSSTGFDTITGFDFEEDHFEMDTPVTGVDHKVTSGTLSDASFDADLAAAIDGSELAAEHAIIFKPDAGDHAGETFVIVDANNVAGYQANADVVIQLSNASHTNSMDVTDFIGP